MSEAHTPPNQDAQSSHSESTAPRLTTTLIDALRKRHAPEVKQEIEFDPELLRLAEGLTTTLSSGAFELLRQGATDPKILTEQSVRSYIQTLGIPDNASLVFLSHKDEFRLEFAVYLKNSSDHLTANELRIELDLNPRALKAGLPCVTLCSVRVEGYDPSEVFTYQITSSALRGVLKALSSSPVHRIHYLAELRISGETKPFYLLLTGKPEHSKIQLLPYCLYLIEGDQASLLSRITPQEFKLDQKNGMLNAKAMQATLNIPANGLGTGFFGAFPLWGLGSKLP